MAVERACPAQQRKALEVANLFVKSGVGFVPVPVANAAEFQALFEAMTLVKLAVMESETEAAPTTGEASK